MPLIAAGLAELRHGRFSFYPAIVGVDDVQFWDFPDSNIRNTPELRAKIFGRACVALCS